MRAKSFYSYDDGDSTPGEDLEPTAKLCLEFARGLPQVCICSRCQSVAKALSTGTCMGVTLTHAEPAVSQIMVTGQKHAHCCVPNII